ncbi:uncharacterized protein PRCAT00005455001 [Priceomyces carsonii]|uniref:uncharacterized protein n=1 Tax=Priceomyces carsonii TaxID=28549 RepID=UPI002EDA4A3F|nr:unnamed protein product [Priceomyces carsonii]
MPLIQTRWKRSLWPAVLILFVVFLMVCENLYHFTNLFEEGIMRISKRTSSDVEAGNLLEKVSQNFAKIKRKNGIIESEVFSRRDEDGGRPRATMLAVIRKRADALLLLETVKNYQDRFNNKYNYDWTIVSYRGYYIDDFEAILALTNAPTNVRIINLRYGSEFLTYRQGIDVAKIRQYKKTLNISRHLRDQVTTASKHFTRFLLGHFYNLESLWSMYDYYWKVPVGSRLDCDVGYDVFQYMKDENLEYGWLILQMDPPKYHPSLLLNVKDYIYDPNNNFMEKSTQTANNFQFLLDDSVADSISSDNEVEWKYKSCSINSEFEIVNVKFFRSKQYQHFFNFIDHINGIYYENWREPAIKTIAVSVFLESKSVKFFDDLAVLIPALGIGNCPSNVDVYLKNKCVCNPLSHDVPYKYGNVKMKYEQLSRSKCFTHYISSLELDIPESLQTSERGQEMFSAFEVSS